jgi:UDP-glucose 4-epimerase
LTSRILVTGGAGFIGSHVVERFLGAGHAVSVIDDLSTGKRSNLPAAVDFHHCDVASREAATLIAEGGFSVVAHLAAQIDVRASVESPMVDAGTNIMGTLALMEALRRLPANRPRVVFASTGGALYGEAAEFPTTEAAPTNPDSPYGIAKLAAEHYLSYYGRIWGIDTVVLRFGNVYGPRQDPHGEAGVVAIFSGLMLDERPITVFGDGQQTRDYIYVADVAEAFCMASEARLPAMRALVSRAYNIGTGVETSVLDVASTLGRATGMTSQIGFAPERRGEARRSMLDPSKARRELGWVAKTAFDDGIGNTVAWLLNQRASAR